MRKSTALVAFVFVLSVLTSAGAQAQAAPKPAPAPCKKFLCSPALLFQPGIMVTNALNARVITASGGKAEMKVTPLVRIVTSAPTRWPRVAMVATIWYTPFLTTETRNPVTGAVTSNVAANAPNILLGPNFTLIRHGALVAQFGFLDGYRRYEAKDETGKLDQYRHNLILAPAINLRFANLVSKTAPPMLRSMMLYAIWQQQLTNMPYDVGAAGQLTTNRAYTPGLFFGIGVPVAPSP